MAMVEKRQGGIPVSVQADLLGINRTSLYYKPKPPSEEDLRVKAAIDKIYTDHPEYGYRRVTKWLQKYEGEVINHKRVLRHMREMGIQAVYPRPRTSQPNIGDKVYPYLLGGKKPDSPNQVWSIDITYIPIRKSWLYMVAIIDWHSRYIVEWGIDDTLEIDFVLDCCKKALAKGTPEIMNSDQGSHFTSPKYTSLFQEAGAKISMDHKGRCYDNIFVERLWRTIKYENVYPKQYDTPKDVRRGLREYVEYYNNVRLHQSLGYNTPSEIHYGKADENPVALPQTPPSPGGRVAG